MSAPEGFAQRSEAVRRAHQVIEAAWITGRPYDLASQAAFALESAQLLQSPETAAEHERQREDCAALQRDKECIAAYAERLRARVAELVAAVGEEERSTGFVVEALTVAAAYDAEADE